MAALNDVKFDRLGALGFVGSLNDRELRWLQSIGAVGDAINDAWLSLDGTIGPPVIEWIASYANSGNGQGQVNILPDWRPTTADWEIDFTIREQEFGGQTDLRWTFYWVCAFLNDFGIRDQDSTRWRIRGFGACNDYNQTFPEIRTNWSNRETTWTIRPNGDVTFNGDLIASGRAINLHNQPIDLASFAAGKGIEFVDVRLVDNADPSNSQIFECVKSSATQPTGNVTAPNGRRLEASFPRPAPVWVPRNQTLQQSLQMNHGQINQIKLAYYLSQAATGDQFNDIEYNYWTNLTTPAAGSQFHEYTIAAGNLDLELPLESGQTYNFVVDWGDGSSETITTDKASHTYAEAGTYRVAISATAFGSWLFNNTTAGQQITAINYWGDLQLSGLPNNAFAGMSNLTRLPEDIPDLSNVTQMINCFVSGGFPVFDGRGWDVSGITRFDGFLINCTNLERLHLDGWQWNSTARINSFAQGCSSLTGVTSEGIGKFPSNRMDGFFLNCGKLVDIDVSDWDMSDVNNVNGMFQNCPLLRNLDISNWDISSVINMNGFLAGGQILTQFYDAALLYWSTLTLFNGLTIDMGSTTYTNSPEIQAARTTITGMGVTLIDGGAAS